MRHFFMQNTAIFVIELVNAINVKGTLCYQGTFSEDWQNVFEAEFRGKFIDILDKLISWYANQRILDSNGEI
jgi:hypothetical protein